MPSTCSCIFLVGVLVHYSSAFYITNKTVIIDVYGNNDYNPNNNDGGKEDNTELPFLPRHATYSDLMIILIAFISFLLCVIGLVYDACYCACKPCCPETRVTPASLPPQRRIVQARRNLHRCCQCGAVAQPHASTAAAPHLLESESSTWL